MKELLETSDYSTQGAGRGILVRLQVSCITRLEPGFEDHAEVRALAEQRSRHEIWRTLYGKLHVDFLERALQAGRARQFVQADTWVAAAAKLKELDA